MAIFIFISVALVFLLLSRAWSRYNEYKSDMAFARDHNCLAPPRLKNTWPWGIDHLYQIFKAGGHNHYLMEFFRFHFQDVGNTLEQDFLGTVTFGTIEPENLEAMLSSKFQDFGLGLRRNVFFPLLGEGIFTQDGDPWKHSREMLRPQFSKQQYRDLDVFQEHVDNLIANLSNAGPIVDLQPFFFRFTLDATSAFLFGESTLTLGGCEGEAGIKFAASFDKASDYIVKRFRMLGCYWMIGGSEFRKACSEAHAFINNIISRRQDIASRKDEAGNRYLFLDALAEQTKNKEALRGQLINTLLAGRDTTACLLTWAFFLLTRNSGAMDLIREEIRSVLGDRTRITRDDLRSMRYLADVLKETLRLYPSVPVNIRTANCTTVLPTGGGPDRKSPVLIRKGQDVAYLVYGMHRRKDLYGDDADEFRPERWQNHDLPLYRDKITATWGYLPFNGGPRVCLGQDFGLMEASYAIVRILQTYPKIESAPYSRPQEQAWYAQSSHHASPVLQIASERQKMTLVMSLVDGCPVHLST